MVLISDLRGRPLSVLERQPAGRRRVTMKRRSPAARVGSAPVAPLPTYDSRRLKVKQNISKPEDALEPLKFQTSSMFRLFLDVMQTFERDVDSSSLLSPLSHPDSQSEVSQDSSFSSEREKCQVEGNP